MTDLDEFRGPLHPAFHQMSAHLIRLAEELLRTLTQPIGDGSDAAADLRDTTYNGAWGRPLFEYVHRVAPLVTSVHDHIRATGALIIAERVVLAPMTVMRTAIEGLSLMHWLYESGIARKEKARRHINLRLVRAADGQNQYLALGGESSGVGEPKEPVKILAGVEESRHLIRQRWTPPVYRERGDYWLPGHIGQPVPTVMKRIKSLQLSSVGRDAEIGRLLYRRLSAVAHAGELGLAGFLTQGAPVSEGLSEGVVGISLEDMALQLIPLLLAANTVVMRVADYLKVDSSEWDRAWLEAAAVWQSITGGQTPVGE